MIDEQGGFNSRGNKAPTDCTDVRCTTIHVPFVLTEDSVPNISTCIMILHDNDVIAGRDFNLKTSNFLTTSSI